jgi:hypothetical protein
MRGTLAFLAVISVLWPASAQAFENFIPLGHNYSPDEQVLPEFNSRKDRINLQTDIYETEVYVEERSERADISFLNRFISSQESSGADYSIDY